MRYIDIISLEQEAERESIEMQANLDNIKEEKERLLNSLVEAEYVAFKISYQASLSIFNAKTQGISRVKHFKSASYRLKISWW